MTTNCPLCRQGGFSCILGGGAVLGQQSRAAKSIPTVDNLLTWLQNDVIFICLRYRGGFSHVLCLITSSFCEVRLHKQMYVRTGCPKKVCDRKLPAPGFTQSMHPMWSAFPRANHWSIHCSDCTKLDAGHFIRYFFMGHPVKIRLCKLFTATFIKY